jgi:hypothetical protein
VPIAADVGGAAVAVGAQRHHVMGEQEPGTEDPGLLEAPLAELGPAQPAREAQVVADQRAGPGLAADRGPLDDQRAQAFRGAVHRSGETPPALRR